MVGSDRMRMLTLLMTAILVLAGIGKTLASVSAEEPMNVPMIGIQSKGPLHPLEADATWHFERLKQSTALWANGKGDYVLEMTLVNDSETNWQGLEWNFYGFDSYSGVRAWDDLGPIELTTSIYGTTLDTFTHFRRPLQPGDRTHQYLAVTLDGIVNGSGDDWRANWWTSPGAEVLEFTEIVTFPSTATLTSISPTPTTRNGNQLEWQAFNTNENLEFIIDVYYTLSSTTDVPIFLQSGQTWSSDPYGNYPIDDKVNTISRWGCNMTSAAMIVGYHLRRIGYSSIPDPRDLNNWMRAHEGYDAGNGVKYAKVAEYAKEKGVEVYFTGLVGRNDELLDNYLFTGNPVMLGVNATWNEAKKRWIPGHYVVATGKTAYNGQPTYSINDPLTGATTLAQAYAGNYASIALYSSTLADKRSLRISAHSPVELVITDPQGRKLGFDPRLGISYNEISEAYYFEQQLSPDDKTNVPSLESKVATIFVPLEGVYLVEVIGTGSGVYALDVTATEWSGASHSQISNGNTTPGEVAISSVNYTSTWTHVFMPITRSR